MKLRIPNASKKLLWAAFIGLSAALFALLLDAGGLLRRLEYVTWSWRVQALARPGAATDRIKVVLIDQYSLDLAKKEFGLKSWPWPREAYRAMLDFFERGGARAVALDLVLTEPSYQGVEDDTVFGKAIGRTAAFAGAMYLGQGNDCTNWPAEVPWTGRAYGGLAPWLAGNDPRGTVVAPTASFPIPEVTSNATTLGNVQDDPDADGVFRRVHLFRVFDGRAVPPLSLAAWFAGARIREEASDVTLGPGVLTVGAHRVPIDRGARAILRFRGPSGTHRAYNAAEVIQSELHLENKDGPPGLDPSVFKDCYVLVGASAQGLLDLRPTPISRVYPGVEIHATALDNFLSGDFLRPAPHAAARGGALLLAVLVALLAVWSRKAWQSGTAIVVGLAAPLAAGFAAYGHGWWWPVVPSSLAVLLAGGGALLYSYATEGRQKAFIKQAFKQYLGQEVIEQMLADPSRLSLGGEKRELTIFFSDIEKFSSFSERLDPPALTALLNDYLTEMGAVIVEEGGYLDKFIGDSIVAFWNAPLGQPDHAVRAVRAALRCQERLAEHRAAWQEKYGALIKMRIGLNTGDVNVGNMGSRDRFNYTVLGDAANLASRLEGANKAFGTYFMVSESTWAATAGAFAGRELGRLRVVGRKAPVRVFEPLAAATAGAAAFEAALHMFYAGKFPEAEAAFRALADDPPAHRYAERCAEAARAPAAEWDGVLNLSEK